MSFLSSTHWCLACSAFSLISLRALPHGQTCIPKHSNCYDLPSLSPLSSSPFPSPNVSTYNFLTVSLLPPCSLGGYHLLLTEWQQLLKTGLFHYQWKRILKTPRDLFWPEFKELTVISLFGICDLKEGRIKYSCALFKDSQLSAFKNIFWAHTHTETQRHSWLFQVWFSLNQLCKRENSGCAGLEGEEVVLGFPRWSGGVHTSSSRDHGVLAPGGPQAAGQTREWRACHAPVPWPPDDSWTKPRAPLEMIAKCGRRFIFLPI